MLGFLFFTENQPTLLPESKHVAENVASKLKLKIEHPLVSVAERTFAMTYSSFRFPLRMH